MYLDARVTNHGVLIKKILQVDKCRKPHVCLLIYPLGGAPYSCQFGEAPSEKGAYFVLPVYERVVILAVLLFLKVAKILLTLKRIVAKSEYNKGCKILTNITTRSIQKLGVLEQLEAQVYQLFIVYEL